MAKLTKDDILGKRTYSCEIGRNAGNSVGEMCNAVLSDERPMAWRLKRLDECARVANSEMRELQQIMRECRNHIDPAA